jgi:hypothetical protein
MSNKDLVLEALSVTNSFSKRVDSRVLSKATELKQRIVSIAQRIYDLSSSLAGILEKLSKLVEKGDKNIISIGRHLYAIFYSEGFAIIRNKPYTITVSYVKGEGQLIVRSRGFEAVFTPTTIRLKYMNMNVEVDAGSPKELTDYQVELKYLLRKLGRIIEYQLLPVIEARIRAG